MQIPCHIIDQAIRFSLAEDIGNGDITSSNCIPESHTSRGSVLAKSSGILCGTNIARAVFSALDADVVYEKCCEDGASLTGERDVVANVYGPTRSILMGERVALNFLQRMSGVATTTREYVNAVSDSAVTIVDTRKTTPGLRAFEKYAVHIGGGRNHRFGLYDAVMIKDNHIRACGTIGQAVASVRDAIGHTVKIEVEASKLDEVSQALTSGADIILLDNMTTEMMREAVELVGGRAITEASGGITRERLMEIARAGVNVISVGALTHSVSALDISLDLESS